jgi:hypothetical protein
MIDATEIHAETLLSACRDRVEKPDAFDVPPAARAAAIGHDDVIERTLVGAAACQPNDDHSRETFRSQKK